MADGAVHRAPYDAVVALIRWITERRRYLAFDGWCAARGVDPGDLRVDRFLNLVTYYVAEVYIVDGRPVNEKHADARRNVYANFAGHLTETAAPAVADVERRTGIAPPSWFRTGGTTLSDAHQLANSARVRTT